MFFKFLLNLQRIPPWVPKIPKELSKKFTMNSKIIYKIPYTLNRIPWRLTQPHKMPDNSRESEFQILHCSEDDLVPEENANQLHKVTINHLV